jgi:hypothetical protein
MRSQTVFYTTIIMVLVSAILVGWDLFVATNKVKGDTISEILQQIGQSHPFVPFAFGVLLGHFFWVGEPALVPWQQVAALLCSSFVCFLVDFLYIRGFVDALCILYHQPIIISLFGILCGRIIWPQPPIL